MKLNINILLCGRPYFCLNTLKQLCKISNENKNKIIISLHTAPETPVNEHIKILKNGGIAYKEIIHSSHDYMQKIKYALNYALDENIEYSMKLDEDIFLSSHGFDFLIENLDVLNDNKNLLLTPVLSNGIPSIEMFLEDVFDENEKKEVYNLFNSVFIQNYWGVNYQSLNLNLPQWNPEAFYSAVKKINHFYKGIHPMRINYQCQKRILDIIKTKKDKILNKQNYKIENKNIPYICNSVFAIKTNTWKDIINNNSLYRDGFDEVPLNLYKDCNNLDICFIRNANALHPGYNTISQISELSQDMDTFLKEWIS